MNSLFNTRICICSDILSKVRLGTGEYLRSDPIRTRMQALAKDLLGVGAAPSVQIPTLNLNLLMPKAA